MNTMNPVLIKDSKLKLQIQKIDDRAVIPTFGTKEAACFDISIIPKITIKFKRWPAVMQPIPIRYMLHTGLKIAAPKGYFIEMFERSSVGFKFLSGLDNKVGIIDSDYRGEIMIAAVLKETSIEAQIPFKHFLQQLWSHQIPVDIDYLNKVDAIFKDAVIYTKERDETRDIVIDLDELCQTNLTPIRYAQAKLTKLVNYTLKEVDKLSVTDRGNDGWGSTGHA